MILMDTMTVQRTVEGILFGMCDEVAFADMAKSMEISEDEVRKACEALGEKYKNEDCGIRLIQIGDYEALSSNPAF